jgi:peptide alpha-N-acetyltransferase
MAEEQDEICFRTIDSEKDLLTVMEMMIRDLSEPYPIYTYRYFVQKWPNLCFLAYLKSNPDKIIGSSVSKLDYQPKPAQGTNKLRGYIAMLSVDPDHRRLGLGRKLVMKTIEAMRELNADEVILETEITNTAALRLYESIGFLRDKRLASYYLNGNDAFKLKLMFH